MKSIYIFFLLFCSITITATAQKKTPANDGVIPKSFNIISAGPALAISNFGKTHSVGFNTAYQHGVTFREKQLSLSYAGIISTFAGKNEKVSAYPYKYPLYINIAGMAGVSYSITQKNSISILIGPGISIYNKETNLNITGKIGCLYQLKSKLFVGASLLGIKANGSRVILGTGISAALTI